MKPEISVISPVFNSSDCLPELHRRLCEALNRTGVLWEIIYVNDCSTDDSADILNSFHEQTEGSQVIVIHNPENIGQHASLYKGVSEANGEFVVLIDADLQDAPEWIPFFYQQIKTGLFDAVVMKYVNYSNGFLRMVFSRIHAIKRFLTGKKNNDPGLAVYRIFGKKLRDAYLSKYQPGLLLRDIFQPSEFRIGTVRGIRNKRPHGKSGYSVAKLLTTSFRNT